MSKLIGKQASRMLIPAVGAACLISLTQPTMAHASPASPDGSSRTETTSPAPVRGSRSDRSNLDLSPTGRSENGVGSTVGVNSSNLDVLRPDSASDAAVFGVSDLPGAAAAVPGAAASYKNGYIVFTRGETRNLATYGSFAAAGISVLGIYGALAGIGFGTVSSWAKSAYAKGLCLHVGVTPGTFTKSYGRRC